VGEDVDRLAPARRDSCRTRLIGQQSWRELLFLHWELPAQELQARLPPGLEVDTFEGRAYLGLVPFAMRDVRVGPIAVRDFLETNLRTYVHARGVPGVWFFSLDAASRFAVWGARLAYRLPYFYAQMRCASGESITHYALLRAGEPKASLDVQWTVTGAAAHAAAPGTLEHFLTERYALYGPARGQGPYRVRVHHPSWPLQRASVDRLTTSVLSAAGFKEGEPIDLILASPRGVAVETFAREPV
jgi:uncharacterized protein YqjF (DUF2071 family)